MKTHRSEHISESVDLAGDKVSRSNRSGWFQAASGTKASCVGSVSGRATAVFASDSLLWLACAVHTTLEISPPCTDPLAFPGAAVGVLQAR
eukprot:6211133-Pleurochrysis_carterae.AAC.2